MERVPPTSPSEWPVRGRISPEVMASWIKHNPSRLNASGNCTHGNKWKIAHGQPRTARSGGANGGGSPGHREPRRPSPHPLNGAAVGCSSRRPVRQPPGGRLAVGRRARGRAVGFGRLEEGMRQDPPCLSAGCGMAHQKAAMPGDPDGRTRDRGRCAGWQVEWCGGWEWKAGPVVGPRVLLPRAAGVGARLESAASWGLGHRPVAARPGFSRRCGHATLPDPAEAMSVASCGPGAGAVDEGGFIGRATVGREVRRTQAVRRTGRDSDQQGWVPRSTLPTRRRRNGWYRPGFDGDRSSVG